MNQDDVIELEADVKLQAVKEIGDVSGGIVDLGVAASLFLLVIVAVVIVYVIASRSNNKRDERDQIRWTAIHGEMIQVVKENTAAQIMTSEAVRDNASATKSVESLIRNMELSRLQSLQQGAQNLQK